MLLFYKTVARSIACMGRAYSCTMPTLPCPCMVSPLTAVSPGYYYERTRISNSDRAENRDPFRNRCIRYLHTTSNNLRKIRSERVDYYPEEIFRTTTNERTQVDDSCRFHTSRVPSDGSYTISSSTSLRATRVVNFHDRLKCPVS